VTETVHKTRAMIVWLRARGADSTSEAARPIYAVCNVHLPAHPDAHEDRKKHLASVLKAVENHLKKAGSEPAHVIVAGDFNSSLVEVPLADYIGTLENGKGSSFGLSDAFPESGGQSFGAWTESGGGPGQASATDHVLISSSLRIEAIRPVLDTEEVEEVRATGLPSEKFPSDHLPLALVVQPSGPPLALTENSAAAPKAPMFATEEEENELLAKWAALRAEAPEKPKGKPSPELVEQLKMHKQREKDFLAELPPEVAKWLEKKK